MDDYLTKKTISAKFVYKEIEMLVLVIRSYLTGGNENESIDD